jgi:DNA repair exonuclease SbcCD nuclease subunit
MGQEAAGVAQVILVIHKGGIRMKFLHTADLQIGARFTRFGEKAEILRAARLTTLKRILEIGRQEAVDAILIAGDLFESNQIANALVEEVFGLMTAHPEIPVVILPGNHDPLDGPGCIWLRKPFAEPPSHVTVCKTRDGIEVPGAVILPVPITQKVSTKDPSLPLIESGASIPRGVIGIGMTHGALAIEGKHQPNDQPISLEAATRAGLDYLALGHWHKPQVYDGERLSMPGTPEPDDFEQASGFVSLVEITAPGRQPTMTPIDCATFAWRSVTLDLLNREPTPEAVAASMAGIDTPPNGTVLRVRLVGPVSAESHEHLATRIDKATKDYAVVLVEDKTSTVLSDSLWKACLQEHPLLAQVVADVQRSRFFTTGHSPIAGSTGLDEMTLDEFHSLCRDLNIETGALSEDVFKSMVGLITTEIGKSVNPGSNP